MIPNSNTEQLFPVAYRQYIAMVKFASTNNISFYRISSLVSTVSTYSVAYRCYEGAILLMTTKFHMCQVNALVFYVVFFPQKKTAIVSNHSYLLNYAGYKELLPKKQRVLILKNGNGKQFQTKDEEMVKAFYFKRIVSII